jgi:thymidylate synthase (FAD)
MEGKMKILDHGFVELKDSMPAAPAEPPENGWGPGDQRVVEAARVSTNRRSTAQTNLGNEKLLRYLAVNRHSSPFEKVRFEFHVKAPLFVARQWMRHRMGSFAEISARYAELPKEFYVPEKQRVQAQSSANKQASGHPLPEAEASAAMKILTEHCQDSYSRYQYLLSLGVSRELSRMVLPVNIYTEFWWTVDLHNLVHFIRLRDDAHAQHEIQVYARALKELAATVAPFAVKEMLK